MAKLQVDGKDVADIDQHAAEVLLHMADAGLGKTPRTPPFRSRVYSATGPAVAAAKHVDLGLDFPQR